MIPNLKKAVFIDPQALEQTEQRLLGEMASARGNTGADNVENSQEDQEEEQQDSILWQAFDSQVNASRVESHQ